ncbi:BnaA01g28320D [Brassica napus]|uniref:BnaA01g28320D protein n=1 Tax=Brassica napus TaxID=3708 RepID=A0A078G0T8_BRANA|nr:BnaA01g28320D [Brassica napus]
MGQDQLPNPLVLKLLVPKDMLQTMNQFRIGKKLHMFLYNVMFVYSTQLDKMELNGMLFLFNTLS